MPDEQDRVDEGEVDESEEDGRFSWIGWPASAAVGVFLFIWQWQRRRGMR